MRCGHKRLKLAVAGSLMGLLAGCSERPAQESQPTSTIATVGGARISHALFEAFVQEKTGASVTQVSAAQKESLLTELMQVKAAALEGEQSVDAKFSQQLELQRLEILARHAAMLAGVDEPVTEDELKQAYQLFVASLPTREYHVAHILVATEATAGVLITRLQAGGDFAKLAEAQSADDSKSRGGELGWIALGNLPVAFTDAVKSLKPGAFTTKPVHTSYGWHVIRLLETRSSAVPSLEQVRAQLVVNLQRDRYAKFLQESLRLATPVR